MRVHRDRPRRRAADRRGELAAVHSGGLEVDDHVGACMVTEFCLTEAARVGQNSLKDGLKVAWRTGDRAEYLGGRRLLLQRLGKVPPHLGELTGARFELLFQLAQRIEPIANAPFRLRSGRTKLAGARRTSCTFARQNHLVGTVTGPPLRPSPLADRPRVLFSLCSAELI